MRHNSRRPNNNNRNKNSNSNSKKSPRTQVYDSNGPDVRIRGTAHQVFEKYEALAKDARGAGDLIMAENYSQHAEHYQRIINSFNEGASERGNINNNNQQQQQKQQQTQQNQNEPQQKNDVKKDNTSSAKSAPVSKEEDDLGLPESMLKPVTVKESKEQREDA